MPKAHARQKNHHIDFARDQSMGEINRLAILLDRRLAHARADERLPAEFLDQPGHLLRLAAFQGGDPEAGETGAVLRHVVHATWRWRISTMGVGRPMSPAR